eukprot:m.1394748 g.1394748  ORF g.1394748 m.1394748 type:complete len:56 (+) comp24993_c0_seq1:5456-5623(+)
MLRWVATAAGTNDVIKFVSTYRVTLNTECCHPPTVVEKVCLLTADHRLPQIEGVG